MLSASAPTAKMPLEARPKAVLFDLLTALMNSWSLWDSVAGNLEDIPTSSRATWSRRKWVPWFDGTIQRPVALTRLAGPIAFVAASQNGLPTRVPQTIRIRPGRSKGRFAAAIFWCRRRVLRSGASASIAESRFSGEPAMPDTNPAAAAGFQNAEAYEQSHGAMEPPPCTAVDPIWWPFGRRPRARCRLRDRQFSILSGWRLNWLTRSAPGTASWWGRVPPSGVGAVGK
jgi:hypothetical protein